MIDSRNPAQRMSFLDLRVASGGVCFRSLLLGNNLIHFAALHSSQGTCTLISIAVGTLDKQITVGYDILIGEIKHKFRIDNFTQEAGFKVKMRTG